MCRDFVHYSAAVAYFLVRNWLTLEILNQCNLF
jgi:hypothetical protein